MVLRRSEMAALAGVLLWASGATVVLARFGPPPSADVSRGTEEAFGRGLHRRELPPGSPPQRWTRERATFTFRDVSEPALVEVEIRDARGPAAIVSDGVVLGRLGPGPGRATLPLPPSSRRTREVVLQAEPFTAGDGRVLGVRLGRVALAAGARALPSPALLAQVLGVAVLALAGARAARMPVGAAAATAAVVVTVQCALLCPSGLSHSPYAVRLAILLACGLVAGALFARAVGRRHPAALPWAFAAMLAGWVVQVVAGTSPVMIVSDAVFHANKLAAVAGGDYFPVSVTQHARPFRFPYGVSFYAVLAPLARAGIDTLLLVRAGAAAAGLAATVAVFLLGLRLGSARGAGLAAVLFQLLPGAFEVAYSFGNVSNAFGQAATTVFFSWWAGRARGGFALGASALAMALTAHFSSFVFGGAVAAAFVVAELRGERDRTRILAASCGVALAVAYYAPFAGMVAEQVPRLLEGGGQGRGASRSAWDAARLQGLGVLGQWGGPALVLAIAGRPWRPPRHRAEAALRAFWIAGLLLLVPAVVSPLEVRYLYGLVPAVAVSAAAGVVRLEEAGRLGRVIARALLGAQAALAAVRIAEAIAWRYRP